MINNYEIMVMLDPKVEARVAHNLVEEVFSKNAIIKEERLEQTDLAYPINKSLKAQYVVFEIKADSKDVSEFTRKANILKSVWRHLIINLDTEKGRNKPVKVRKNARAFYKAKDFKQRTIKVDSPKSVLEKHNKTDGSKVERKPRKKVESATKKETE